jgi:putative two-component system response regulator
MMPGMDGYEVCKRLKSSEDTVHIPVIFVTAMSETEDEAMGLQLGAVDYITKPVNAAIVKARVKTHLTIADSRKACEITVRERTQELAEVQRSAIFMLGDAGHYNDTDTGIHSWRMAAYAGALARAVNWHVDQAEQLQLAATMHDTGKVGISDSILKAERDLDPEEWEIMKTHSEIGYRILSRSNTSLFRLAAEVARYHHEKWDGTGYPLGLKGEAIPESARIVAVADVFDALTNSRPYKRAWSLDEAFLIIKKNSGIHFEPSLVEAFLSVRDKIEDIKKTWDRKEALLPEGSFIEHL